MESGFSYGDIIVIGAIAAFILLRYRAMLGQPGGREPEVRTKAMVAQEFERVIQLPASRLNALNEKKDEFAEHDSSLAASFVAMRGIDREFSPDIFLQGARMAYEMVIEAFNKTDRDTLKMLLSDTVYAQFDGSLNAEAAANEKSQTTLVAINSATIKTATLAGNIATIGVDFVSEQIQLVRDTGGAIIEGDATLQQKIEDSWVFTRNLASSDLNWKIIET